MLRVVGRGAARRGPEAEHERAILRDLDVHEVRVGLRRHRPRQPAHVRSKVQAAPTLFRMPRHALQLVPALSFQARVSQCPPVPRALHPAARRAPRRPLQPPALRTSAPGWAELPCS